MTLLATGFGWIETDSGRFDHDIVVFAGGRTENRYHYLKGSNHRFGPDEARTILGDNGTRAGRVPESGFRNQELGFQPAEQALRLVVGTGQYGVVAIQPETRRLLESRGVQLHAAPTPEAVVLYNRLPEPKCALFHVTC